MNSKRTLFKYLRAGAMWASAHRRRATIICGSLLAAGVAISCGTVSRQLNKRTKVSLKYGYFTSKDDTSGNNNDFDAHLIYATLQYRF